MDGSAVLVDCALEVGAIVELLRTPLVGAAMELDVKSVDMIDVVLSSREVDVDAAACDGEDE